VMIINNIFRQIAIVMAMLLDADDQHDDDDDDDVTPEGGRERKLCNPISTIGNANYSRKLISYASSFNNKRQPQPNICWPASEFMIGKFNWCVKQKQSKCLSRQ